MSISRPERVRERGEAARARVIMEGEPPSTPRAASTGKAQDLREMLAHPGWKVLQEALILKNQVLWNRFTDPMTHGQQAEILRMQAIKYSGIEDIIAEILGQENKVQRRDS